MQIEKWSLNDLKESVCPICNSKFKIGVMYKGNYICCKCFKNRKED